MLTLMEQEESCHLAQTVFTFSIPLQSTFLWHWELFPASSSSHSTPLLTEMDQYEVTTSLNLYLSGLSSHKQATCENQKCVFGSIQMLFNQKYKYIYILQHVHRDQIFRSFLPNVHSLATSSYHANSKLAKGLKCAHFG